MDHGTRRGEVWAIVLAAGEGTRLAAVTRRLYGRDLPKQFAALTGPRTLLQMTMDRIASLVPPGRTVVVVGEAHAELARAQLCDCPGVEIVAQPRNLGTGVGTLLPLVHVLARDPEARVLIFPSDHHVRHEPPFLDAVRRASLAAEEAPSGVCLVGAAAEGPATDLGWIVPSAPAAAAEARAAQVARFVEKPAAAVAAELFQAGSLWNTLIIAAGGRALGRLVRREIPEVAGRFEEYRGVIGRPQAAAFAAEMYSRLPRADLSRDILERAAGMAVVAAVNTGWSDCGTPERLLRCLEGRAQAGAPMRDSAAAEAGSPPMEKRHSR
jgi:mannose-1-phosphate guanylyltransferase